MATAYKLVQRRDMHKGATEGDKLYYAQAKSTGTSDMERFCSMIGERSCVSSADVKAVLDSLIYVMKLEISDGKIVQLGEFSNFRITLGSEGTKVGKDFSATKIRRPKYIFSPDRALHSQAKALRFEKVSVEEGEGGNNSESPDEIQAKSTHRLREKGASFWKRGCVLLL